jgi:FkbM family methyltransferase
MMKEGLCTIQFNAFIQDKMTTQVYKGGNTEEFYDKEGTRPKSQMLKDMHPEITEVIERFGRIHHYVYYDIFKKNKLIMKKKFKRLLKDAGEADNYGMKIVAVDESFTGKKTKKTTRTAKAVKIYSDDALPDKPMRVVVVKDVKALCRIGTSDEFVVDEVIKGNTYRKLKITSKDIILDCGLNIGMFTTYALLKGAKKVYGYEPEPDNFKLAKHNIKLNGLVKGFKLYNKAVIGNNDKERRFSINVKKNKGAHSLVSKRGRTHILVRCSNINKILKRVRPTIIKMDIEGGEYECIKAVKSFAGVKQFILEFHHAHLNDIKTRTKYREIIKILKKHFKTVEYREETKKAWVTLIYCKNGRKGQGC